MQNKNMNTGWGSFASPKEEAELSIDLYETDRDLVIQSTIAGVKAEDLEISIENNILTIKGSRKKPEEPMAPPKDYIYQECYWGPFSKKIILPSEVDFSKTKAQVKEGVLTIKIPKLRKEEGAKIEIEQLP